MNEHHQAGPLMSGWLWGASAAGLVFFLVVAWRIARRKPERSAESVFNEQY